MQRKGELYYYIEVILTRNPKLKIMIHWKTKLLFFAELFLYSVIIILMDVLIIFLFFWDGETFVYNLSLIMLIEGGLGLIVSSVLASYSPSVAKLCEILFHSKPYDLIQQKETEKQMKVAIVTALILIIEALLVSAL